MKKKFLSILTLCIMVLICAIGLVACNGDDTGSVDNRDKQIVSIYNTYVAYAEENGQTPLSYEEWLNSIKGKDGINGLNGKDGLGVKSVVVNNDGHLIITYTDNNSVDAGLVKGKDGLDGNTFTIEISNDGYWVIGGNKTNVKAQGADGKDGENGQDGVTPTISISQDGYWVINNEKTSVKAVGVDGKNGTNGTNGQDGSDGVGIADMKIENGKLFVKYTNSQDFVELGQVLGKDGKDGVDGQDGVDGNDGKDGVGIADIKIEDGKLYVKYTNSENFVELGQVLGKDGKDGVDGKDGREIKSAEIDKDGNLIITYKNDTTENLGKIKDNSKCEHEYSDYIITEIGDIGYRKEYYCKKCHEEKSELYIYTEGVEYALSEDGESAYVKSIGTATDKEIVLRNTYQGKPVSKIAYNAFSYCDFIESVVISDNIKRIEGSAFRGCKSLTKLVIPSSVIEMHNYAFGSCNIKEIYYDGTVDDWCGIKFQDSFNSNPIEGSTNFYIKNKLVIDINITEATNIEKYAFYNCSTLKSIKFGDQVESIGSSAFFSCSSLESVTIGNSVKSIGNCAFYKCSSLESVTIPNSVTSIEGSAFNYCSSLTSVTIGNSVKSIGDYAFSGCRSLTSIEIPDSVTIIRNYAFNNCSLLESVTIPNSVTSIEGSAFNNCSSLTSVNYLGTIDDWCEIEFVNEVSNPLYYAKNLYINDNLVTESIITTATKINNYAFMCCESLTSVVIGDSVESIGCTAFSYCNSLSSVTIGNGVTNIGEYAFYICENLTNLTLGNNVTTIGNDAFYGCNAITKVNYLGTIDDWCEIEFSSGYSNPLYSGNKLYINNELVTEVNITKNIIKDYTFYNCTALNKVTLNENITHIGSLAFYNCNLSCNEFNGLKYIGNDKNPFIALVGVVDKNLTSATIVNGTKFILDYAFFACSSLTSIDIPDSVIEICSYAFCNCSSLMEINLGNGVKNIGKGAFNCCTSLSTITWGENLKSIGASAFFCCRSLESIEIPDSVEFIGSDAFRSCEMSSVVIGENVEFIGNWAFKECPNLTSITFKDTTNWYTCFDLNDWQNKTGGNKHSVEDSSANASYLTFYYNAYWYKLDD